MMTLPAIYASIDVDIILVYSRRLRQLIGRMPNNDAYDADRHATVV